MHKKTKTLLLIPALIFVIALVFLSGCKPKAEEEVIKIGAILPLSGEASDYGMQELEGIKLAINETPFIHGKRIILLVEDSKNDPKEGLTAFNKLVNIENVSYLFGSMSSVGLALKDQIKRKKIPTIWVGGHPDLTKDNIWIFRNMATTEQYVDTIIKIINNKNIKKLGIFYINDDFGESVKNQIIKSFKGEITDVEMYSKQGKDFRTEITKLLATNPETIFIAGYGTATGLLIKQLREMGYKDEIFGTTEISSTNTVKAAGDAINGVIFPDYYISSEFKEKYKLFTGKEPTPDSLVGYVGTKLLLYAIQQTNGNKLEVRNKLLNLSDFSTITGKISIRNNEIEYQLTLMMFVNNTKIRYK